ncbi:MAG: HAMP domain-containing histidine kinase [Synechococcales cyanobacterium C42_A2020_086]|nr:HAMP domain-containing histidine kinase [Synechococcales cyanobacterium C42_A2020_086]
MFRTIQHRLLLSYLVVLTIILGSFALVVRVTFARSLHQELTDKLMILAQAAATDLEAEDGRLRVESDEVPATPTQALQWFDVQGASVSQQGNYVVTLPLDPGQPVQTQTSPHPIQAVTIPIYAEDGGTLIGYVRASESLEDLHGDLRRLDWGLAGGVILALSLSGVGGIWLTRQAMQPIEDSFRRLQQFTADASHELRSPLMAIESNAAVALKYPEGLRETHIKKFRAIASATAQMTALTEDLLMLARTDQTPTINQDIIDLKTILENLFQLYTPHADAKQIRLKLQSSDRLEVRGDAVQLTRLLTNLIDNALRYTREKGTVNIEGIRERNVVLIHVQDAGIGIDSEQLKHIFDRFWRADQARSYSSGGFGLGLAIAQGIAQRHGGSITVSSQPGVGSCFTVRLPAID